ncbi:hypothetical protein TrLO_g14806 [Triparma laevis f. longispina]|uniref:PH domain-containing protein n=1 Tax=Triparma laevis f. longispina TaxID=1714387 RepID=A0A9W7FT48_9STRA|nr:hypothetical protein TrLO_g14806 [Triparma laevis f. longispina]
MLETVVFLILRSLLGHFIDLSRSHLNLSIWSGSFTFTDLFIRPSLLSSLGLPVTLFEGKVGALSITIPWRGLWKEKVKIVLNDVVVLGESNEFTNETNPNRSKKSTPKKQSDGTQEQNNADQNIVDSQTQNSKPTASYLTKLLSTILHNVSIEINNVTVQYVTPGVSKPPHKRMPCSVTLRIESVGFLTCGEGWEGEAWYDPYGLSADAEPCYERPFYKTCTVKGIKGSITDNSDSTTSLSESELFDVNVGLKLKIGSFNDGEPCVNEDGTDKTGVEVVNRDDSSPVPLRGLFGGRNVSVNVSLSSKGWGGEANKPGLLDGLLGKKPDRFVSKSSTGIRVNVSARDVEMLWGAAEEFRLAKQRAVARRRMEQAANVFGKPVNEEHASSQSNATPPVPNHKLDLKDIDAVDEVLKGVPDHLLPPMLGEEIKGERKRSMLLQQQQLQQLQQRPRVDSKSDDEDEIWADAEEGVVTPPTPMFLPVTRRTNSDPTQQSSTQQEQSPPPPTTPQTPPEDEGGWWGKVKNTFMSDKKSPNPDHNPANPDTPPNPFLQPPLPSSSSTSTQSPRPSISINAKPKRTDFHGIVNFRMSLPGLQVNLNPSPSSSTLKRPVQLAIYDVLLTARMRKCPEAWLPDIIDRESEAISQLYFVALSITDAAAIEKGTGLSTLPVLVDVDVDPTDTTTTTPKALQARFERSTVSGRGSSTVVYAKLVPLSVVLDYDLIRRAQRFFIPPTAPISISMSPAKIGNLVKKEREMQEMKYNNASSPLNDADFSSHSALHLMSLDLDVGLVKIVVPIDREIPNCPVLKLELQTHAQHSNPADQKHRLEELRKKSLRKHTFTFNVTALNASWATPIQIKLDQPLPKLSAKAFQLENEEHMLLWDLTKTPIKVELKVKSIAGKQQSPPRSPSPQSSPRAERSSGGRRKRSSSVNQRDVLPEAFNIAGPAVALDDSALWLDYDSIDDASLAPISISITIPELRIRLSTDLLMQVSWLVGYILLQHSNKKENRDVTPSLSLTAFTLIMEENVHQLHLNATVPKIALEVTTPSVLPNKNKDWFADFKTAEAARGEKLGQTYGPEKNEYTRPFNFPNLPPTTPILVIKANGIEAKKQSATYASQLDIYLDQLSVSMHNYGVPHKHTKPEDNSFHTEGCDLFNVLQINQKVPSSDFARSNVSARRLLRIVKHPVGCHWMQDGDISSPMGIGKQTLTVHVQAVDLKVSSEPLLFGRVLHLIAASKKAMALGAKVKEDVWGNVMIENAFWTAMAAAAMPDGPTIPLHSQPPKPSSSSSSSSSSPLDPSLTLNIATGSVQIKSYWGKDPVDILSFDSSTTCMQKFDKMAASSAPLTLLGSIENLKLRDLTDYGRQAYKDIIAPCAENVEGVTAEWTFSAASVNRTSPPTFGIRLKGMKFIYAQRKVMENFFYWQKWFCGHFRILSARPEDVLAGSIITKITASKNYTWVQGCDSRPFRPDKHPGWRAHKTYQYEQGTEKEKVAQEAKIEILAVDSEIWLLHDSKHFDAIKIKFPTFKMWKAVSSEENYYSSPLLDQHKFAHEIPSMNRTARVRGKRVMSFSDLSEFGIRKKRLSEHSVDIDMEDIFADVENAQNDRKGELNAFLNEQIHTLRLKEKDLKAECDRLEDEYAKEDSVLEQLKLDQDSSMLASNDDERSSMQERPRNFTLHSEGGMHQSETLPQFQSDATAKEFISQMAKVEHLDRKHSEALERLAQIMAEINALHEEIDWLTSSKEANSNLPQPPEGRFDMELVDCTLSTILSPNPIQHHLTVKAWLALGKPLDPWGNALYSDVYQTLGVLWDDRDFDVGVVKTPMDITVMLPRISWTLTQAQYAVILGLIMDNFGEDQTHVPNPNPEDFDPVFDETVVGKTVFDDLGVQVSVPVYFEAAKIVVTEDEETYFENLDNAMAEEGGLGGFGLGFSGRTNMGNDSRTTSKSSDVGLGGGVDWSNHDSTGSLTAAALRAEEEKRRIFEEGYNGGDQIGLQLECPDKESKQQGKDGQSPFGRLSDSESSGIDSDEDEYDVGTKTRRKIRGRSNTEDEQLVKTGIFKKGRKSPGLGGGKRNTNHLLEDEDSGDEDSSSISDSDYSLTSTDSSDESSTTSLESDSSEQRRTAYPIFVIQAEQLFLGIDKNKEGQGVYLEVTSKSLSLHDVTSGNTIGGHEVLGPSNEVKNQQRQRLNTLDHKFRGRLSTLNTHTEEDYNRYDDNSMTDEGSIRSDNNYNSPPMSAPTSDAEDEDLEKEEEYLQLRYTQHNYGPAYRRVGVYVDQTVLTCYGDAIKRLIAFFYDPVKAHGEEEMQLRRLEGLPDWEEDEKNWDIDVQVTNTQVCLLEQLYESESRALVLNADFGYFHRWRGYPNHGTKGSGSIDMVMELLCRSMFFANQGNLRPSDAISLVSPFRLKLDMQTLLPCLSVGLGGTPSEAAVIKKTVLLWTERADHSSELSELDALHGDVEKAEFGTPGLQTTSGLVSGGGGDRIDASTLIDLGVSLPDIKLIGVVVKALITDLKRNSSNNKDDDEGIDSSQHSTDDADEEKSVESFSSPARKSSSRSRSGSKPNLLSPSLAAMPESTLSPSSSFNSMSTPFKNSPGQMKQPLAPQTSFAGVLTNVQVLIGLSPTRVSFINNVMGIPLCSILLSDMNVTMSRVPRLEGLRVYGMVTLGGSYFNHLAHRWDPLVETTTLEVDVAKELKTQKTKAKVALKDPVNINLTHALLRLCAHDSLLTDHVTSSSKSLSPYLILNRCGERCVCYFKRSDATVVEIGVNDDNSGLPLDFRTIGGQTRRSSLVEGLSNSNSNRRSRKMQLQGVQTHTLGVSVTISGWVFESANSVPMDVAGIHTIRLQAMAFREEAEGKGRARGRGVFDQDGVGGFDGGVNLEAEARHQKRSSSGGGGKPPAPPLLVAEVTLQPDGSKQITIRSRVAIQNTTGMPTFVRLSHKESTSGSSIMRRFSLSNGRQEIVKKLIGGEVLYVPISFVKPSTGIWVRPSEKFEWSPVVDWLSDLEVQDNVISMSTPKSGVQHENEGIDQVSSNKWSCQMEVSRVLWHSESDRGVLGEMEDEAAEWEMKDDADEDEDDRARSGGNSAPATEGLDGKKKNSKKGGLFSFDSMFSFNKSSSSSSGGNNNGEKEGLGRTKSKMEADETTLVADHQKVVTMETEDIGSDNRPALLFVRPSTNNGHKLASVVRKGDSLVLHVHANDGGSSHKIIKKGQDAFDSLHDDFFNKIPSMMPSTASSSDKNKHHASPLLTLSLLPPMVLHNLLCVPLLYRVTDRLGAVAAEGVIPIGTSLPLFRLDLRKKLYLSVRVVNYGWSEFSKLHTPRCVHPHVPKRYSVEMRGGKLKKPSGNGFVEMDIPTLRLKTMVHGRHVRIYSRVWIVNHTDLTLQYRESSAAAGVDAPSFLRSSMPILTHKSLGAIGNTSADVERYAAHANRDSYGFGPDDYDDEKIEWQMGTMRGKRKEIDEGSKEKSSFFGGRKKSSGSTGGVNIKDSGGGGAEIVKTSQQESTSSLGSSAGGIFGGVFGGGRDRNVSDPASERSVETAGNVNIGIDDALDGLDEFGFESELMPPSNHPFMMRKRTTSVGGEDSASVVSEDSGFGSVDHRTDELLHRVNKYRSSPTMSGSMSELSERTSQRSLTLIERRRAGSREERLKRKSILLSRETSIALQKKLEARIDRTALEKRKILHKRRVINGITVRLPTNHLHRVTLDGIHSDDTLHDLFHKASLVGGLRWSDDKGNSVGVREKDYFFAYFSSGSVWVPESDGGIGFMFGGYAPLSMSTQLGALDLFDLRLCHRIELHVAWQQLDLNNTSKGNVKLPRYIDWGEAIMFSPPSTLGMRFHLCTRVLDSEWSSPFDANGQKEVVSGLTSCLTLRQLKMKKRARNILEAGGWGDDLNASTPPLTTAGGKANVRRTLQANRAGGGLARLAEEGEGGLRDSFNGLSGLDGTGTLDEDTESNSDGEDSDEGDLNDWGAPLAGGTPGKNTGKKKVQQKRTTVYKPAAVVGDKKKKDPRGRRCQYDIGVHCTSGQDVYFRTTVITFLPRYVLVNDLRVPIELTQFNCEEDWRMTVPGGTSTGFHWPFKDKAFLMSCRLQSDGFKSPSWTWSGEFSIDALGEVALKVRQKFRRSEIFLIRVVVKIVDASIVVLFEQVDEFVPYRIDNETSHRIRFRQGISDESKNSFDYMMPRSSMPYSWDFPMGHKSLQIEFQQGSNWVKREYKLDALHDHSRVKLTRSLPNLSNPEFEGFLERRQGGVLEAGGKWARVYCVLKASTMYIFRPPKTGEKSGMLNRKKTEQLDLLGVLTVGPGAQFSLMKGWGSKGNNSSLNLSKNQIKQCATVQRSWSSKFTTELQKMAESAIAVNGGAGGGGVFGSSGEFGPNVAEAARKREEERSTTIAVLLQRYLKDEGRKGGYFKARIIDDVQPSSNVSPLTGPHSFGSSTLGGLKGGPGMSPTQSSRKTMPRRSSLLSTSGRRTSSHNLGGSEAGFGAKATSRFFMNGNDWIGLIIKLGICGNRGKALSCCNDLMQRGYLALSDTVSGADGLPASSADGSGTPVPSGRRGKRMSLQLSSHTPRRLRLESNMSSGAQSRGGTSNSKRSVSPKRDAGGGIGGGSISGSERSGVKGGKSRRSTLQPNTATTFFPSGGIGGDSDAASKSKKGTLLIDFFQDSATVTYVLLAPTRDEDINLSGSPQFEVATATGNLHKWRAKTPNSMKQWVVALRNAADNAALSILTVKPEKKGVAVPDSVQRSESKDALSTLLKATGVVGVGLGSGLNAALGEKVKETDPVTLDALLAKTYVKVKVKADGPTKVLELSEEGGGADDGLDGVEEGIEGGEASSKAGMMKKGFSQRSLTQVFGGKEKAAPDSDEMTKMRFEGELMFSLGVSVIDKARESTSHRPRELVFLTMGDVKAITRKSLISTEMSLTVEKLQIDNQLHDCYNPTIVRARPLSRKKILKVNRPHQGEDEEDDGEEQLLHIPGLEPRPLDKPPAMHFFASRSFVDAKSVVFWDVVTLWLHPLDVKLEERLLLQALKLKDAVRVKSIGGTRVLALTEKVSKGDEMKHGAFAMGYNSTISGGSEHLVKGKMDSSEGVAYGRKRKVFVNFLHLHPVDISLSFKAGGVRNNQKRELGGVGEMAISAIGGLDDTRLKLGALQINNAFGSKSDLVDRIVKHYIFASMKQVHVLGNVEFLGNPVGLVNNLGTGVRDFFYEPIDGLTGGDGSKSFLEGLKRGTTSLGSNFGEGAFNTMSKMTGALGEGIAHISFDDDYQANRSAGRLREAKTASQGLRKGIFEFGESLGDAVGGVIMQPIRGMEKEGGLGFVKGVAKGVVGVPVKTVVGVLDLASRATEGVKNEAKNLRAEGEKIKGDEKEGRVRHPRSFGKRGELIEYDAHSARKQKILARVAGGKYANEHVSLDWLVKTLQAPLRKNTVFSGNEYDLEKMVMAAMEEDEEERGKGRGGASGASGYYYGDAFEEDEGVEQQDKEDNFDFNYSERYIILTNRRLMYLSEDRGTTSMQVKELREDGEESGGSTADLQELLTQSKPKIIWVVPPSSITKLRIERNGIRVMLNEAVRFEVLQDLVPCVHDMKSQEALVFSSVCEKTLGVGLAASQHLYPPSRSVVVEGALQRSKALLGSVTETYYYCLCGNVLYEYSSVDKARHRTLRMIVPLSNVTIMLNPGRDIVLKPIPPAVSIAVATRSTKFHFSAAINKIGVKLDKFKDHLKADDEEREGRGDEEDGGGYGGGDGKKPLLASSRDEVVLQPADRGCGATLEEWYKGIRERIVIGSEDKAGATTSLFIECNGLSNMEMSSLSSSLVGELNAQRCGDEELDGFGLVDLELLKEFSGGL